MLLVPRWRSLPRHAVFGLILAVLAGCASAPPKSSASGSPGAPSPRTGPAPPFERDGPDAHPPADLASVPDAEPKIEPIRAGGPNKPYGALGREYVPLTGDRAFSERGLASWYGKKFHGRRTASGEPYDMYAMTAAHPTLPIPSYVRVRNPANEREVVVRVNDRGPFHSGRVIDLSYTAALKLGVLRGVATVELTRITFDDIRTGSWRKGAPVDGLPADRAPTAVAAAPDTLMPEPLSASAPAPVAARPARGFWVQLGAFRQREGADSFQRRVSADLDWLAPLLAVFSEPSAFRLQAGPYATRDEAQGVARRIREALQLVPTIVERR
ncbi:septal ring lytic transglycosylase RlpA family protein [Piscinibacter sp.]|uniref:septal ring lytic transglycosylase RlpA family protein n=1 Tax=Piscinibacter sp. TaxID=1903157 RepID=UPI002F3E91CA